MTPRRVNAAAARALTCLLAALAAVLAGWSAPGYGDEDIEEHFKGRWYYTEVLVFDRTAVLDYASEEQLARAPVPLPRTLLEFRSAEPLWAAYPLTPEALAFTTFPVLELRPSAPVEVDPRARPAPPLAPVLGPDPLLDFLGEIAAMERTLADQSEQWLPAESFALSDIARRLERRNGFRVLLHGRWLQNVPARETPQLLRVHGGTDPAAGPTLEGLLSVTLGRYLHFRADLYYQAPLAGRAPVDQPLPPPGMTAAGPLRPQLADLEPAGYVQIHQTRRLRSGELHYLDHPKLGVLVRIDPVEIPESLLALHEALEQSEE